MSEEQTELDAGYAEKGNPEWYLELAWVKTSKKYTIYWDRKCLILNGYFETLNIFSTEKQFKIMGKIPGPIYKNET